MPFLQIIASFGHQKNKCLGCNPSGFKSKTVRLIIAASPLSAHQYGVRTHTWFGINMWSNMSTRGL